MEYHTIYYQDTLEVIPCVQEPLLLENETRSLPSPKGMKIDGISTEILLSKRKRIHEGSNEAVPANLESNIVPNRLEEIILQYFGHI